LFIVVISLLFLRIETLDKVAMLLLQCMVIGNAVTLCWICLHMPCFSVHLIRMLRNALT